MINTKLEYELTVDMLGKFQREQVRALKVDSLEPFAEEQLAALEAVIKDLSTELHVYRLLRSQDRE